MNSFFSAQWCKEHDSKSHVNRGFKYVADKVKYPQSTWAKWWLVVTTVQSSVLILQRSINSHSPHAGKKKETHQQPYLCCPEFCRTDILNATVEPSTSLVPAEWSQIREKETSMSDNQVTNPLMKTWRQNEKTPRKQTLFCFFNKQQKHWQWVKMEIWPKKL